MNLITVGDLITVLSKFDQTLPVVVYVEIGEDMDTIHNVRVETRSDPDTMSYCKGDHVLNYQDEYDTVVVIG